MPAFAGRDPTQSLSIEGDVDEALIPSDPAHPSLALGTHEARGGDEYTRIDSPGAQRKQPSAPPRPSTKPPPVPRGDNENLIGQVLGSYRVTALLGKGGMGQVFRAEHVKLGREVALKLLRKDYAQRRDAVARFFQEARTVNRVRHRNIVDVTDFVELDDGTTFIIMELLSGQSLGKWARTGVDLPRALAVLVQISDGLAAAHHVGVVHRDLKPDNVIVVPTSDGAELVKLLDFGVAKLLNRDDEDIGFQTAAGSVIGTPAYMSPEQAGGMVVDARSDIYSLGAIMYELFCGQPMFRGRSFGEYVRKHLTEMPPLPRSTPGGAQIDPRLEALIMRCLEKDPNLRFQTITELRDSLLGMLGGMDTHLPALAAMSTQSAVRPPLMPAAMSTILPPAAIPHMPTPASGLHPSLYYSQYASQIAQPPPAPATPWWAWFAGGAVAVGIGVAAAIWYAGGEEPKRQAVVAPEPPPVKPTITQAEPPKPTSFEVKFDSLPSGGVYADGQSAELCRTPCAFSIKLDDGGPTDKRTYVVRADGYKDTQIVVDLAAARRDFKVTLEHVEPVAQVPEKPVKQPGRPIKKLKKTTRPDAKPDPKGPPTTDLDDPTDGKVKRPPPKPDKPDTIDKTELSDPFKRNRTK